MSDNTKLNEALDQGEVIVWSGTPQAYSLFGESYKKSTMITLGLALAWAVILVGGYYALTVSNNVEIQKGVMLFCIGVPIFIIGMAISDKNKIQKLAYAVTDKRAIVLSEKPISMRLADIDDVRIEKADDGNCHVRVGSPTFKTSMRKLPVLAYRGEFGGQGSDSSCNGLVFFNVSAEDERKIRDLLKPAALPAKG